MKQYIKIILIRGWYKNEIFTLLEETSKLMYLFCFIFIFWYYKQKKNVGNDVCNWTNLLLSTTAFQYINFYED